MNKTLGVFLGDIDKDYLLDNDFKYALIYYLNDLVLDRIENIEEINKDILVEAMFFNDNKELHFFEYENDIKGVLIEKDETDIEIDIDKVSNLGNDGNFFYEEYLVKERLGRYSKSNKYRNMKVINYLDKEDDGQSYVKATCLCGLGEVK